jgi:dihydropteroate synthase
MNPRPWRLRDRTLNPSRRPLILGIVNVTPDSFSDGGRFLDPSAAVAHGLELVRQGADLLDVGGESTRPGSQPVPADVELDRVLPVVRGLADRAGVPVSVDTSKASVARACLEAGAAIVNDVTGLRGDPDMPAVVRDFQAAVIVMHMLGTPATMQDDPRYGDVVGEVGAFFEERLQTLTAAGIALDCIALDPGIGFGKTLEHNLALLAHLTEFGRFGRPLCLGVSRKGLLGKLTGRPVGERVAGGLAVLLHTLARGATQVVRVHDVAETRYALDVWAAIESAAEDHPPAADSLSNEGSRQ